MQKKMNLEITIQIRKREKLLTLLKKMRCKSTVLLRKRIKLIVGLSHKNKKRVKLNNL